MCKHFELQNFSKMTKCRQLSLMNSLCDVEQIFNNIEQTQKSLSCYSSCHPVSICFQHPLLLKKIKRVSWYIVSSWNRTTPFNFYQHDCVKWLTVAL